jgi:hypothetical protein
MRFSFEGGRAQTVNGETLDLSVDAFRSVPGGKIFAYRTTNVHRREEELQIRSGTKPYEVLCSRTVMQHSYSFETLLHSGTPHQYHYHSLRFYDLEDLAPFPPIEFELLVARVVELRDGTVVVFCARDSEYTNKLSWLCEAYVCSIVTGAKRLCWRSESQPIYCEDTWQSANDAMLILPQLSRQPIWELNISTGVLVECVATSTERPPPGRSEFVQSFTDCLLWRNRQNLQYEWTDFARGFWSPEKLEGGLFFGLVRWSNNTGVVFNSQNGRIQTFTFPDWYTICYLGRNKIVFEFDDDPAGYDSSVEVVEIFNKSASLCNRCCLALANLSTLEQTTVSSVVAQDCWPTIEKLCAGKMLVVSVG